MGPPEATFRRLGCHKNLAWELQRNNYAQTSFFLKQATCDGVVIVDQPCHKTNKQIQKQIGPHIKQKHTSQTKTHTFRLQEIELWLHPAVVAAVVSYSRSTRHGFVESAPWSPSHWICQLRIWCCGQRESHVWHLHTRFATQKDGNKNAADAPACGFLDQIHDLCMVSLQNIFLELHKNKQ